MSFFRHLFLLLLLALSLESMAARKPKSCLSAVYNILDDSNKHPVPEVKLKKISGKEQDSPLGYGPMLRHQAKLKKALKLEKLKELKIATYNVENLIKTEWKLDLDSGKLVPRQIEKSKEAKQGVAKAIKDMDVDLAIFQEIGRPEVLEEFIDEYLDHKSFKYFHIKGNDKRGIHVAAIFNQELPLSFEWHSFKNFSGVYKENEMSIFSRDLPLLIIKHPESDEPLAAIAGVHFKSKRSLPDDPEAVELRAAQVKASLEVKSELEEKYGEIPIFFAGDFNNDLNGKNEVSALLSEGRLLNSLDHAQTPYQGEKITHTYHPRKDTTEAHQIDGILFNQTAKEREIVLESGIYRYLDQDGNVRPYPTSNKEKKANPSDHFPVFISLDLKKLLIP